MRQGERQGLRGIEASLGTYLICVRRSSTWSLKGMVEREREREREKERERERTLKI